MLKKPLCVCPFAVRLIEPVVQKKAVRGEQPFAFFQKKGFFKSRRDHIVNKNIHDDEVELLLANFHKNRRVARDNLDRAFHAGKSIFESPFGDDFVQFDAREMWFLPKFFFQNKRHAAESEAQNEHFFWLKFFEIKKLERSDIIHVKIVPTINGIVGKQLKTAPVHRHFKPRIDFPTRCFDRDGLEMREPFFPKRNNHFDCRLRISECGLAGIALIRNP